jgi:hypothetical protein
MQFVICDSHSHLVKGMQLKDGEAPEAQARVPRIILG